MLPTVKIMFQAFGLPNINGEKRQMANLIHNLPPKHKTIS